MRLEEFNDIENFFNAYKARNIDLKLISRGIPNRKVLIMHIGGIVIECLLKHRVVKEKNITKSYCEILWFDDDKVNKLIEMQNVTKGTRKDHGVENPGHNLIDIARMDSELNLILVPNGQLAKDLEFIHNPLQKSKKCFIDLRYVYDVDIDNLDEIFEKWNKCFERAHDIIFK